MQTVRQFNQTLLVKKICTGCPMQNKGTFVGVDTATGTIEKQPVMFLGLNPGTEEAKIGRPFVGPSGSFLRKQMEHAHIQRWFMANSLLCSTANEQEIPTADYVRKICHVNLAYIFKIFQPQLIVPCGNGAWSIFGRRLGITQAAAKFFISCGPTGKSPPTLIVPILHPSALIRSGGESSPKFAHFFHRLQAISTIQNILFNEGFTAAVEWIKDSGEKLYSCFTTASPA